MKRSMMAGILTFFLVIGTAAAYTETTGKLSAEEIPLYACLFLHICNGNATFSTITANTANFTNLYVTNQNVTNINVTGSINATGNVTASIFNGGWNNSAAYVPYSNTSYVVRNATGWLNEFGYNGTYGQFNNITGNNIDITGTLNAGVSSFSGNNGNAAFTLLNLNNNVTPTAGQLLQTSDLAFDLTQNVAGVVSLHEAAKISAYKVSDWENAGSGESYTDSGLRFYTTSSGVSTLQLTIADSGLANFIGNVESLGGYEGANFKINGATHTDGKFLRASGAACVLSTLMLPNAITDTYVVLSKATNTYGSDAGLTYDDSTDLLTVTDSLTISGGTATTDGLTLTGKISMTSITGASSTTGSTGSTATLRGGTGGAGTAGSGGSGGDVILAAASGGTGTKSSTTVTGGSASTVGSTGSSGGSASGSSTCTSATGGKGSSVEFYSGAGGSASNTNTASTGGDAGNILLSGYNGGDATVISGTIHTGGKGSDVTLTGGTGGAASGGSASNTGGAGGTLTYTAGIGGTGTTANGANGNIIFKSGATEIARFDNTAGAVGNLLLAVGNYSFTNGWKIQNTTGNLTFWNSTSPTMCLDWATGTLWVEGCSRKV